MKRRQLQRKDAKPNANAGFRNTKSDAVASAKQGDCRQFLKYNGKCSRGEKCEYTHDWSKIKNRSPSSGRKGKGKDKGKGKGKGKSKSPGRSSGNGSGKDGKKGKKGKSPSRPYSPGKGRGRSESGVRGTLQGNNYVPNKTRAQSRGKSPSGDIDRPPCKAHYEGHCSKGSNCREWHISDCKWFKQNRCTAGNNCLFYHRDKNGKITNGGGFANSAKADKKRKSKSPKKKKKASSTASVAMSDPAGSALSATAIPTSPLEQ